MARTLDPEAHAIRRDSFTDVAQRLIQAKGYEQLSVQDVLDELGASKGAFYHYFDSKQALLESVVDRMVEAVVTSFSPVAQDPSVPALAKLNGLFAGIVQYKNARLELIAEIFRTWISDDNALVREKLRRGVNTRLTPVLAGIVRQGRQEGSFTATSSHGAAVVVVSLMLSLNEQATQLFLARQADTVSFEEVEETFAAYFEAIERTLGAPAGSFAPADPDTVRLWFG